MKSGVAPTALNARTGESTPPGRIRCARAKSLRDLSNRIAVQLIRRPHACLFDAEPAEHAEPVRSTRGPAEGRALRETSVSSVLEHLDSALARFGTDRSCGLAGVVG